MIKAEGVLYIEPQGLPSLEPLIDDLTVRMAAAFHKASVVRSYRGFHVCSCGVTSTASEYLLASGEETNSLCVHYLAWHRDEVPDFQLDKVRALPFEEVEVPTGLLGLPTAARSQWPRPVLGDTYFRQPWEIAFHETNVRVIEVLWLREHGASLDDFLKAFPAVPRWQAEAVWRLSRDEILAGCKGVTSLRREKLLR
jgi:hypothetical protein